MVVSVLPLSAEDRIEDEGVDILRIVEVRSQLIFRVRQFGRSGCPVEKVLVYRVAQTNKVI